jgi:hypothetical protein
LALSINSALGKGGKMMPTNFGLLACVIVLGAASIADAQQLSRDDIAVGALPSG